MSEMSLSPATASPSNLLSSKSADYINAENGEEKWSPNTPRKVATGGNAPNSKISKVMKRKYLLEDGNEQLIEYVNDSINNGLKDKDPEARNTAFKLLMKLEKESDGDLVENVLDIDAFGMSKFRKWKERKQKGKGKRKNLKNTRRGINIRRKRKVKKARSLTT